MHLRLRLSASALAIAAAIVAAPSHAQTGCSGNTAFNVGSGVYDITGPAAELGMMGYAMIDQKTTGIHQRLRSRAFVFVSPCNNKRAVFVSADLGQIFQVVKQKVMQKLTASYGSTYTDANVMLTATHTHAGPGGFSHYALYNLTVLGFDSQNLNAISDGIYQSIVRAHNNVGAGTVKIATGTLTGASVNRSPEAYLLNPSTERALYSTNVDQTMTVLRLQKSTGTEVGQINWFPVHATSMGNDNLLISGDNKGYAAYQFEKAKGTNYASTTGTFVAAFANSNEGDVSPNIYGGENGGGANDFESTKLSADKQYTKAKALYDGATQLLTGGVDYRHTYVAMDTVTVSSAFGGGTTRTTCEAAIGTSMLAGAEDGPGFGYEGMSCGQIEGTWEAFNCLAGQNSCQGEKPVVLETGTQSPYPWTPEVMPLQILRIGNLALVGLPAESTTMAGRRLVATVKNELAAAGVTNVIIAGLANAYAGYVATREEYAGQYYEGASTHFGPWTLGAYQQEFQKLAVAMRTGAVAAAGPVPRDLTCCQTTLQTGVVFDDKLLWVSFGGVVTNANASYVRGQTVSVKFWGGHPKNNLKTQGSYLEVQRKSGTSWITVASDWDWETKYIWARNNCAPTMACSHITTQWTIPTNATLGIYRIRHYGHWKSGWDGSINAYTGTSREFTVN
jgi:neutral ceramidase